MLLQSGVPLRIKGSFYHQLHLLASAVVSEGWDATVRGGISPPDVLEGIRRMNPAVIVLLGYPDQFPFLDVWDDPKTPLFLWAQFSRPPKLGWEGKVLPVPLTKKTAGFLEQAGVCRMGPTIPHGVDTTVYRRRRESERRDIKERLGLGRRFVAGTVAAHTPRKCLDRVMESFALFSHSRDRVSLLLKTDRVVSHDGVDLRILADRHGLSSQTKIVEGSLPAGELADLYSAMDVFVNLSEWEGFGLPVVEAMACGVPVLSLPIQGPGETVPYDELMVGGYTEAWESGSLLLHANPHHAARRLIEAYDRPEMLSRLSRLGRREVSRRYDIRRIARLWIGLVERAYNRGGREILVKIRRSLPRQR
jgi:glycosyltransferase involved in cell wall biosynthesis